MARDVLDAGSIMSFEFKIARQEATHFHRNIEIFYVLEGTASITVEDQTFEAEPDAVIIINSNKKHSYEASDDILIGIFEIDFAELCHIMNTNQVLFWCNSVINKNSAFDEMRELMKNIFSQYFEKDPQSYVYAQSLIYQLLKVLLDNFLIRSDDQRFAAERKKDDDRLVEISNYINMNYQKRLTLSDLAGQLYLSVPYLSKYIKIHLGMNFVDYLNRIRLFHAVDDLLYTDHSITNIAIENGFANTAAFNDLFKKEYGHTPSEYRRQMKENNVQAQVPEDNRKKIEERVSAYFDNHEPAKRTYEAGNHVYMIVDANESREYEMHWKQLFNVGRAGDLLRSDVQEHVKTLKQELGFKYARVWDIFGPEMMMDENNEHFNYNFERIDRVLDFLVENHLIPYIEMAYKPRELHRTLNDLIIYEPREIRFKSIEHAQAFFATFARHLMNRYGVRELVNWVFEQWCGEGFVNDLDSDLEDQYFFSSFESLYTAFKRLSPEIKIGGGGIGIQAGSQNLRRLVQHWEKKKYVPDFLSLYFYPYVEGDDAGLLFGRLSSDKDFLKNQLLMARETLGKTKFRDVPVHVSEWSSTISNRNILNDSSYKAAYVMKSIIDSLGMSSVLGYWIGSDLFAEYYDSKRLLFGGCGLLSKDGIKKPSFYAYRFLNNMGKYLVGRDEHSLITTDRLGNYDIVCHNYRHLNYKYYLKHEDEVTLDQMDGLFEDNEMFEIDYQLAGVKNGSYKIKTFSMSPESGSVLKEWENMGMDRELIREEIEYLKRICTPRIHIRECEVTQSVLNFEVHIKPHEIMGMEITYLYE